MRSVKRMLLVALGFVLGVGTFEFCRSNWVDVNLRFWNVETYSMPLWLVVLGALVVGLTLPVLVTLGSQISKARDTHRLKRRIRALEQELTNLRNIAIDGPRVIEAERTIPGMRSPAPQGATTRALDDDTVLRELGLLDAEPPKSKPQAESKEELEA